MLPTSVGKRNLMVLYKDVWSKSRALPWTICWQFSKIRWSRGGLRLSLTHGSFRSATPGLFFYFFIFFFSFSCLSSSLSPFLKRMGGVELHLHIRIQQLLLWLFFCCCFCRCCFCFCCCFCRCCFSRWCWFSCWNSFLCFSHWFCCSRFWCCRGISGWGGGVTTLYLCDICLPSILPFGYTFIPSGGVLHPHSECIQPATWLPPL